MDKSTIFRLVKNKIDGKIWKLTGKIGSKKLIDERGRQNFDSDKLCVKLWIISINMLPKYFYNKNSSKERPSLCQKSIENAVSSCVGIFKKFEVGEK